MVDISDRVREVASGSGTTVSLQGAVDQSFSDFSGISDSTEVYATIVEPTQWGCGRWTKNGTSLSLIEWLTSSNGVGVGITMTGVTGECFIGLPFTKLVFLNENDQIEEYEGIVNTVFQDDIAAMQAMDLPSVNGIIVFAGDGLADDDGLGGFFRWDSTDSSAPDGRDTFRNSNSPSSGLYKRIKVDVQRSAIVDLWEVDTTLDNSDGAGVRAQSRLYTRPKGTDATAYFYDDTEYVDADTVQRVRGARALQSAETPFSREVADTDATLNRTEFDEPIGLPPRADRTGLQANGLAEVGGEIAHGQFGIVPSMVGGYVKGVYETVAAAKAADLRNALADGDRFVTLGQAAANDGIYKTWIWNSGSTTAGDDIDVIDPTPNPGAGRALLDRAANTNTFADADATPDISASAFHITSNAGTGITDFDGKFEGHRFLVKRGTADCTITAGVNINTINGDDIVLSEDRSIAEFAIVNDVAYEVGGGGGGGVVTRSEHRFTGDGITQTFTIAGVNLQSDVQVDVFVDGVRQDTTDYGYTNDGGDVDVQFGTPPYNGASVAMVVAAGATNVDVAQASNVTYTPLDGGATNVSAFLEDYGGGDIRRGLNVVQGGGTQVILDASVEATAAWSFVVRSEDDAISCALGVILGDLTTPTVVGAQKYGDFDVDRSGTNIRIVNNSSTQDHEVSISLRRLF